MIFSVVAESEENMKSTQKQQETVDRFLELENEYGKGNVFIRWINNYWNTMFIVYRKGEKKLKLIYKNLLR